MYSFVTVNSRGQVTRLVQTTDYWTAPEKVSVVYYVNVDGYVEFDGSAHVVSSHWLADCIGRWTHDGDIIRAWN